MANITFDACPNFNGGTHDNGDLSFVPWQLQGAHLFGLSSLGSTFRGESSEKNPCTWERNPGWVKLTDEQKEAKRAHGEKIEGYYLGWGVWEGGVKKQAKGRYGVCLTRSKFFVLDIDTHEVDGNETFANWLQELGLPNDFQTFTVATGTGGFHYYFQIPQVFQDTQISKMTNLLPGIDVFPSGQYVVGPGTSRTMKDGSIARYEVSRDLPIAEMPDALADALVEKLRAAGKIVDPEELARQEEQRRQAGIRRQHRREHPEQYDATALSEGQSRMVNQLLSEMSSLAEGTRHDGIFQLSHSIGKMTGWDHEEEVLHQVLEAAVLSGHSPCAEKDARDGYTKGAGLWVDYREQNRLQRDLERKMTNSKKDQAIVAKNKKDELPELSSEFFNDGGVASAYQAARAGELMSVDEWNSWMRFAVDSGVWKKTNSTAIVSDLLDWYRDAVYPVLKQQLRDEAEAVKDDADKAKEQEKRAAKLLSKATGYLNLTPCRNATGVAFGRLMESVEIFDADRDVLHINGTAIDLRTTKIRSARAEDYFTLSGSRLLEVDPDFTHGLFELILGAFLPETREYMQVLMGSALTGHQPNPAGLFFLQADGDNGKSTFSDVFKALLGGYSEQIDSEILLNSQNSKTFANIRIKGKRFIPIEELPKNGQLDSKASKGMAGTKQMTGAHKGVDEETFDVQATFLINTNFKLKVSETDRGTRKRLKMIPMPYTFLPQHEYDEKVQGWRDGKNPSPAELKIKPQDPRLDGAEENPDVLKAALAWALEGARKFYANGKRILPETPAMKSAKDDWLASQDRISLWWDEYIVEEENSFCLVLDLHESYERSVLAGGSNQRAEALRQFMEMLKSHDNFKAAGAEHFQNKKVPTQGGVPTIDQSFWTPEQKDHWDKPEERRRTAKAVASFVKGIRFKTDADFAEEAKEQGDEEQSNRHVTAISEAEPSDDFEDFDFCDDAELQAA